MKYSPLDVEAIIDRIPGIARSAIVPYPDAVLGELEAMPLTPTQKVMRGRLRERLK